MSRARKPETARPRTRALLTPPEPCGPGTKMRRGCQEPPRQRIGPRESNTAIEAVLLPARRPRRRPAAWTATRRSDCTPSTYPRLHVGHAGGGSLRRARARAHSRRCRGAGAVRSPDAAGPKPQAHRGPRRASGITCPDPDLRAGARPASDREGGSPRGRPDLPSRPTHGGREPPPAIVRRRPAVDALRHSAPVAGREPFRSSITRRCAGRVTDPNGVSRDRGPVMARRFRVPDTRVRQSRRGRNRESKYSARFL